MVVAVAFTRVPASQSPNVGSLSDEKALSAYFRAMVVTFASVSRHGDGQALCLVTDAPTSEPYAGQLKALGVTTLIAPFRHRPPVGFASRFNASLYSLDAIHALMAAHPEGPIVLLDPDCVCIQPVQRLIDRAASSGIGAFPTGFDADEESNGLTANEAGELHRLIDPELVGVPAHYGGECYVFTTERMTPVLDRAETAWLFALERAAQGLSRFTTEEHLFNYALRYTDVTPLSGEVKRIWTAPQFRNVAGQESRLTLWHLPSEKDRSFLTLHESVLDRGSWFWQSDGDEFRRRIGQAVGIPHRRPRRWAYDTAGRTVRWLQAHLPNRSGAR